MTRPLEVIDVLVCCRLLAVNAVEPSLASAINQLISNPKLSAPLIAVVDMPTMRIRRYWPGESRLGRLAMDLASSVSVPLSAVPPEISRLVLESLMPPAPSRRSTVGRRSVDESLLVPLRAFSVYG